MPLTERSEFVRPVKARLVVVALVLVAFVAVKALTERLLITLVTKFETKA